MKNVTTGSSTIVGNILEGTRFTKARDFVGAYKPGQLLIQGILKTHSDMYNKDQYSLYIVRNGQVDGMDEQTMLMNIPSWYGSKVMDDLADFDGSTEEFFKGASLKSIAPSKTKYNTDTYMIDIYES